MARLSDISQRLSAGMIAWFQFAVVAFVSGLCACHDSQRATEESIASQTVAPTTRRQPPSGERPQDQCAETEQEDVASDTPAGKATTDSPGGAGHQDEADWSTAFPESAEELREDFPIHSGMSRRAVLRAVEESRRKSYETDYVLLTLTKRTDDGHIVLFVAGRNAGLCLVAFAEDEVRSVWYEWGSPWLVIPHPFLLSGDSDFPRDPVRYFPNDMFEQPQ